MFALEDGTGRSSRITPGLKNPSRYNTKNSSHLNKAMKSRNIDMSKSRQLS
jgi:hypothetical protein